MEMSEHVGRKSRSASCSGEEADLQGKIRSSTLERTM